MKRKRILSLLLALTVMATMLMAVPLTGYAAETETETLAYNSSSLIQTTYSDGETLVDNDVYTVTASSNGVVVKDGCFYTNTIKTNTHSSGVTLNGSSGAFRAIFLVTPHVDGELAVLIDKIGNNKEAAIVDEDTLTNIDGGYYLNSTGDNVQDYTITGTVTAGKTYLVGGKGTDIQIGSISLTYEASSDPSISFDTGSYTIYTADGCNTVDLAPTVKNIGDYTIEWSTSDDTIATVEADTDDVTKATVTAGTTGGTVTITATMKDGDGNTVQVDETNVTASCTVTVEDLTPVTSITISGGSTVTAGLTTTLTATVTPTDATYQTVTWSSDTTSVATIDEDTGVVTGVAAGSATIKATATDGSGVYGELKITVEKAPMVEPSTASGTTDNLVTAPVGGTTLYDLVKEADENGAVVGQNSYSGAGLYFDDQVYLNMEMYARSRTSTKIDNSTYDHAYRVKGYQFYVAVKLAPGATVSTYANLGTGMFVLDEEPTSSNLAYGSDGLDKDDNETITFDNTILASVTTPGILEYKNDDTEDNVVYITAMGIYNSGEEGAETIYYNGGDSYITQIQVDVPEPTTTFDTGESDSGYYTDSLGQTLGVIRFLQEFTTNTDTTGYGFYFVDSEDGGISSALGSVSASGSAADYSGFYTDLTDIPEGNFGTTYYALPFVTYNVADGTSEGTTGYEYGTTTISGTVNAGTAITDYIYSDWKTGGDAYNDDGSVNGSTSVTTTDDGVTALKIASKNAYYTFDEAISSGTVTFSTDAYVPDTTSKLFRIHLENTSATEISNSSNVFAEALSIVEGSAWVGPVVKANDNSGTNVGSYTETGWYHIEVVIDYDSYTGSTEDKFITINVTSPSGDTVVDTTIGSNSVDGGTTLNQIRLVGISADQYFANMSISVTE